MTSRQDQRYQYTGVALTVGAGAGAALGVVLAGGAGIAMGGAIGAGLGVVVGAVIDAHAARSQRSDRTV